MFQATIFSIKLIKVKLPGKWVIFFDKGSGKTHLSKILEKKINKINILDANNINDEIVDQLNSLDCLIIENFKNNIEEKLFYSILNHSKQLENFIVINSLNSIKNKNFSLKDLQSRINSFTFIGIELPTDDLLNVIISKFFSENRLKLILNIKVYYPECRQIL